MFLKLSHYQKSLNFGINKIFLFLLIVSQFKISVFWKPFNNLQINIQTSICNKKIKLVLYLLKLMLEMDIENYNIF
jgi:hypothetical protein